MHTEYEYNRRMVTKCNTKKRVSVRVAGGCPAVRLTPNVDKTATLFCLSTVTFVLSERTPFQKEIRRRKKKKKTKKTIVATHTCGACDEDDERYHPNAEHLPE